MNLIILSICVGVVTIVAILVFLFLAEKARKTDRPILAVAGVIVPIGILFFGIEGLHTLADNSTANKVAAAVDAGYVVYVDGKETDPAVVRKEAYACGMVDIRDDIREVHVATRPKDNTWSEENVCEKVFVNGTEVDKSHLSLDLYDEEQALYDAGTKTLYIITES